MFVVACAGVPGALDAQQPSDVAPRPPASRDTVVRDTTVRDTARARGRPAPATRRDSLARAGRDSLGRDTTLFVFAEEDSVIKALRARPNYNVVRYQGDTVRFGARDHVLTLRGKPSAVEREKALLVGPTIRYDDSTQVVTATADSAGRDSVVLRDPTQGSDVVVRTSVRYNLNERRGVVRGFSTSATQGETWYVMGGTGVIASADSLTTPNVPRGAEGQRVFYAHDASVTSCDEEKPHYHFVARDVKMVSKRLLVIRPATLYIGDVPVLWLPFVYQDTRPGPRSGLLRPVFGPAELLRNSPTYQRSVRHFGYYTAINDYADASTWIDYRSGARPGGYYGFGEFTVNLETRYRSIDRQLSGDLAIKRTALTNGQRSLDIYLNHQQQFTQDRNLQASINFSQNTTIQRINQFDPNAVLGSIRSNAAYSDRFGPVSASVSAAATEYAGRPDRELDFPTVTLNSRTISVTPWLDWTPTLSLSNAQQFRIVNPGAYAYTYTINAAGNVDSTRVNASTRQTTFAFATPIKIFGFQISLPVSYNEQVTNAPTRLQLYTNIRDTTTRVSRTFAQTFNSNFDIQPSIALPAAFQGTWNVSPTVNLVNVDQGGLYYRSQYTGGQYVSGAKRLTYGLNAAPTLYAFIPGFGPIERIRNSINPSLSYTYSPTANVSDEYLAAIGAARQTYLGSLKQNRITLGLSTNFEAKMRARPTTPTTPGPAPEAGVASVGASAGAAPGAPLTSDSTSANAALAGGPPIPNTGIIPTSGGSANAEQKKVKLLSLQFSSLSYDFARADTTGRGFVDPTFSYTATTDLIPGFTFRSDYSLYLGDPTTDTARFKPYRTGTSVSFQLDRNSAVFGAVARLFGLRNGNTAPVPSPTQNSATDVAGGDPFFGRQAVAARVAGSAPYDVRNTLAPQNFTMSVTYTESRQRPDIRGATTLLDPASQCISYVGTAVYDQCIATARNNPVGNTTQLGSTVRGAPIYISPAQRSLSLNTAFHITQKWAATWSTLYDAERKQFASNTVSLQRELHDWRASFNFTQSPNGNFAFSFNIALKAEPDLKFDYNRQTVRSSVP